MSVDRASYRAGYEAGYSAGRRGRRGDGLKRQVDQRRRRIMELTADGLSAGQIAIRLGVTRRCVERHRAHARREGTL